MAKKVMTPEEYQARIDKKVNRRKIFFGTFTKSLAFFLAIAMVYTLATIAFTPTVATAPTGGNNVETPTEDPFADMGDDSNTANNSGASNGDSNSGDASNSGDTSNSGDASNSGGSSSTAAVSKADAVKLLNDVTAAASKGDYSWKRNCAYTPDGKINVGSATNILNTLIQGVVKANDNPNDDDANLGTVVGNFIGIGDLGTDVKGGKLPAEGMSEKHLLKAMTLTEGDVVKFANKGTTYLYQLSQCKDPQKDGKNALHRATNDFITHDEVAQGIKDAIGDKIQLTNSEVIYDSILIKATIDGGKLKSLELSYIFSAKLNLKAGISITGTGKAKTVDTYSNIAY